MVQLPRSVAKVLATSLPGHQAPAAKIFKAGPLDSAYLASPAWKGHFGPHSLEEIGDDAEAFLAAS
jgi:hypothetical protein